MKKYIFLFSGFFSPFIAIAQSNNQGANQVSFYTIFMEWGIPILISILLILLGFLIISRLKKEHQVAIDKKNQAIKDAEETLSLFRKKLDDERKAHAKEKADLERKNKDLEEQIKQLKALTTSTEATQKQPQLLDNKTIYLSIPSGELKFNHSYSKNFMEEGSSFYAFHLNGNEAAFEFIDHPSAFNYAIGDTIRYINPACEAVNAPSQKTTKIVTVNRGKAILEDNFWHITQKAIVTYK